jgi:hypothetical protein
VFITVWQEAIFNILIEKKIITSPYCLAAGHTEAHCLTLVGFGTSQAAKGVRTISCLIIIEMLLLSLMVYRLYSYRDGVLQVGPGAVESKAKGEAVRAPWPTCCGDVMFLPDICGALEEPSDAHFVNYQRVDTEDAGDAGAPIRA